MGSDSHCSMDSRVSLQYPSPTTWQYRTKTRHRQWKYLVMPRMLFLTEVSIDIAVDTQEAQLMLIQRFTGSDQPTPKPLSSESATSVLQEYGVR
jgi:hypothetical protein